MYLSMIQKSYIERMSIEAFSYIPQVSPKTGENIGFQKK